MIWSDTEFMPGRAMYLPRAPWAQMQEDSDWIAVLLQDGFESLLLCGARRCLRLRYFSATGR